MKRNLVRIDNYLFAVGDKEFNKGSKVLHKQSIYIVKEDTGDYLQVEEFSHIGIRKNLCKKILSHRPLNGATYLDGVDVLPKLNQNDEIDKLAEERFPIKNEAALDIIESLQIKQEVYAEGYNKAREKFLYTEEDVFGFLTYYNSINFNKPEYRYKHPTMDGSEREYNRSIDRKIFEEYIQSIQQPKLPVAFECEMELVFYPANMPKEGEERPPYRPKIIINSEGRIEWVGKYIY
jgi:hypothetical protein